MGEPKDGCEWPWSLVGELKNKTLRLWKLYAFSSLHKVWDTKPCKMLEAITEN